MSIGLLKSGSSIKVSSHNLPQQFGSLRKQSNRKKILGRPYFMVLGKFRSKGWRGLPMRFPPPFPNILFSANWTLSPFLEKPDSASTSAGAQINTRIRPKQRVAKKGVGASSIRCNSGVDWGILHGQFFFIPPHDKLNLSKKVLLYPQSYRCLLCFCTLITTLAGFNLGERGPLFQAGGGADRGRGEAPPLFFPPLQSQNKPPHLS